MRRHRQTIGCCVLFCFVLLASLLTSVPVFAQAPIGTILGVVKDSTGGTVSAATVTVTNADTALTRTATTGDDGAYRFPALPVGNYQIQVTKDGFQTAQRKGITLEVAQEASIDIILQVGSTGQTVVVTEEAPLVQTTSSTVGGLVTEQQVTDLPLNGRNLVDLTLMQAGVTQTYVVAPLVVTSGFQTGVTISNNGMPVHSNSYTIDGADMMTYWGFNATSIIGQTMGVDGVKEYKVVSTLPDATYGLVMGGQTTLVSKGGTNQFHGDAFDFLRNGSMDARNFFDALDRLDTNGDGTDKSLDYPGKRIPPFHRENFGGSVGGPIRKDKTFFYAVYEGLRQTWGQTVATTTLVGSGGAIGPANCWDQTVGDATYHQITAASLSTCSGVLVANENPYVLHLLNGSIIPGLAGLFPYPNANIMANGAELPGATLNSTFPYIQPSKEDYGQIRLDQNLSAADTLFGRFTQDEAATIADGAYFYVRSYENSAGQFATLAETHIFSPSLLNTFRFSFSRNNTFGTSTTTPRITDPGAILQPGTDMGGVTPSSGVTGLGFIAADGQYFKNTYSLADDIFWTKGKHAFKFGTLINNNRYSLNGHFNNRATVSFSSLADLAGGVYSGMTTLGGTISPSQERDYGYYTFGFYVQDDYRFTPRLTLNLGFRYEFQTIPNATDDENWQIQSLATANGAGPTQGAVPSPIWSSNPSLHAFSPRIGFAWDPFGNGKMAIRGGGGIYYDIQTSGAQLFQMACCNPPLDFFNTISNAFTGTTAGSVTTSLASMATAGYPVFQVPLPIAYGSTTRTTANPNGVLSNFVGLAAPRNEEYYWNQPADYQWNLTIDRQLRGNQSVTVAYVGARGTHIIQLEEGNPTTILGFLPNGLPYYCHPADNLTGPPSATDQCPATAGFPAKSNPTYGPVSQNAAASDTWYQALQVNYTKRLSHGITGGIAYTWEKMLDTGSGVQGVETAVGQATLFPQVRFLDKAVSGFDVASNFRANVIYHVPEFHKSEGWIGGALSGWWLGSIVSMQTGYPFDPSIAGRSLANNGQTERPNLDPSFNLGSIITHNPANWFNESMYDLPIAGTIGNAPRFGLRGPDLQNVDFSLNKDSRARFLGEQGNVELRAEVFNIMNRPNFSNPSASMSTALASPQCGPTYAMTTCQLGGVTGGPTAVGTEGQITTTTNRSRQIQLSLKVIF
jgi:hypothetical protein